MFVFKDCVKMIINVKQKIGTVNFTLKWDVVKCDKYGMTFV